MEKNHVEYKTNTLIKCRTVICKTRERDFVLDPQFLDGFNIVVDLTSNNTD